MELKVKRNHWNRRGLLLTALAALVLLFGTMGTYAWFSSRVQVVTEDGEQQYVRMGMSLDMLFDRLDPAAASEKTLPTGENIKYDQGAEWGSAENPYIISNIRHLQNLSVLQNSGYFKELYIDQEQGKMPYFLVCTPEGAPVTVDGMGITITPIGTNDLPFVGFVGGAFAGGDTTVNGMNSDTSVISGLTVTTDEDAVDVGLFGTVGIAKAAEESSDYTPRTTIKGLVLSDVCLTVGPRNHSLTDIIGHLFSFSGLSDEDQKKVPNENHHIGIFAGHVENADVDHISVYYSSDAVTAMNVQDSGANYLSATGIIGFFDDMNGQTSNSVTVSGGAGTGGGTLSGTGRGYMSAKDIAEMYPKKVVNGEIVDNTDANIKLLDAVDENGNPLCTEWVRNRLLWGTEATDRYYFYDGVFTFALSDKEDTIRSTWNGTPDTFFLGEDDNAKWKKNTSEGTYAVTAFIKPVANSADLNAAVVSGRPILVSHKDTSNQQDFLLTLSEASAAISSGFFEQNNSYTAAGTWVSRADNETMQSVFDSFNNSQGNTAITEQGLIVDSNGDGKYDALGNNIEMLNLGASSEEDILKKLSTRYNVKIVYHTGDGTQYRYFDKNTPAYIDDNGLRVADAASEYYYYTFSSQWEFINWKLVQTYTIKYYYSGSSEPFASSPNQNTNDSWAPEGFVPTDDGNGLTRHATYNQGDYASLGSLPLLYSENDTLYYKKGGTQVQLDPNGLPLIPREGAPSQQYLKYNVTNGIFYFCDGRNANEVPVGEITENTDPDSGGTTSFTYNGVDYSVDAGNLVFEKQMDFYTLNATEKNATGNSNSLKLIEVKGFLGWTKGYSIWCGEGSSGASYATENATIKFADDGSCFIRYSYGTEKRYVNFNTTNFNGQSSESDTTKLYIYTLEGTSEINYGHITFEPNAGTTQAVLSTDKYVLWPDETAVSSGAVTVSNPIYTVKSLDELYAEDNGWQNKNGEQLTQSDLTKKFHMNRLANWGAFSGLNINWNDRNLATEGIVVAPIGSNGVKANIPQGSVAFRINKAGASNIRVIVALPQSDLSEEERQSLDASDPNRNLSDCYFGLWKVEANGESLLSRFSQDSAQQKFYIPKSEPYAPNTSAADATHYSVKYGDETYRLYPNGSRILIAYTFTVSEEGVYVLGTTGQPMEIVYFSADGSASGGRDGVLGSALGGIDFVYDYNGKIIAVKDYETDEGKVDDSDGENYNNYYASLCLMYTDNGAEGFPDINSFSARVRRYIGTVDGKEKSCLDLNRAGTNYALVQMKPYSINSDKVTLSPAEETVTTLRAPQKAPAETIPEESPETTTETSPEETPETTSETPPETPPETTPEATPEATPETTPEATPETAPETPPETPETTPEEEGTSTE